MTEKPESFQRGFLLLLVAAITLLFLWMVRNFLVTLLFAAIFSSLLRPLYLRIKEKVSGKKAVASGITIFIFVIVVILPLFGFLGLVAGQALNVTQDVAPWVHEHLSNREKITQNLHRLPGFSYIEPYSEQILSKVGTMVTGLGNFILHSASVATAGTLVLILNFVIMTYAMFFFFIDGPAILQKILYYMPLKARDEKKLLDGFRAMAQATIKGIVVIGAIQGAMGGVALWAAGVPSALFWGTVMAVASVIPNVGAALVWVPACIYLFIKGQTVAAILVLLWCALAVGTIDNVLRPILVGKDTKVPELLVFISTLGGLSMLGLEGFVLGPVLALMFLTVWEIYGTVFKDVLPKTGELEE